MAKYKLPEGFKLRKTSEGMLLIIDLVNDQRTYVASMKDVSVQIDEFVESQTKFKNMVIPDDYKIELRGIQNNNALIKNGNFIKFGKIEDLIKEATTTTELDLQIAALNNGEEIEI